MGQRWLIVLLGCLWSGISIAGDFRVTFVNPGGSEGFWGAVSQTMEAAAEDLNIDLEILNADRRPYGMEEELKARLETGNLPDYFILVNELQAGPRLLGFLKGQQVDVLMLLNTLTLGQKVAMDFSSWDQPRIVAGLEPDNETAGHRIAASVIKRARELHPDKDAIRLLALTGDSSTPAALDREAGLIAAVAEERDVRLVRAIPVQWNAETAYQKTKEVLAHKPVDAIWAANDDIALGAMRAAREHGLTPGKDIACVGMNWSLAGMEAVRRKELTLTDGGHFFAGAWALVVLRDFHFGANPPANHFDGVFEMSAITPGNVDEYLAKFGDADWDKIDFAGFTKTLGGRSKYDFSANAILTAAGK